MTETQTRNFGQRLDNVPAASLAKKTTAATCSTPAVTPKPHQRRGPIVISVEAAIGTGKSTLLRLLQKKNPSWRFVQEPVDQWQSVGGKHNLLEAFYTDKQRYAFSFQTFCVLSRIEAVTTVLSSLESTDDVPVVVLERSWLSDRNTFAEMHHAQHNISEMEWCLYDQWYNFAVRNSPKIHGHVYLECTPDTCMTRLRKRHRSEEVGVTDDYQKQLIAKHEEWLQTVPESHVCRINADKDFQDDEVNYQLLAERLANFITSLEEVRDSA